jgi:hypothetical protein
MKADGYDVEVPDSVEALRAAVLEGNAKQYGQEANVAAHVTADEIVAGTPWLKEIEKRLGPGAGPHPVGRARGVHPGRAIRQGVCRRAADLRL